ncbi:MAG: sigma-54-dependent Fis family transcriptional regulator [Desulfovibrio sp.]|nr:sigma-54-dependent Fis family transcriptional regulator [Desulfovibrio sp.]
MTPSSLAAYQERPSRDFFISGGLACRLMYRNEGIGGAMRFLLQFLHGVLPVTRINLICTSKDLRNIVPLWDSDPKGISHTQRVRKLGMAFQLVAADDLERAAVINDLSAIKEAVKDDDAAHRLPFYTQEALVRLPLFERGSLIFLINFWSLKRDSFHPADPALLRALITPLAREMGKNFSEELLPDFSLVERSESCEALDLCQGLAEARAAVRRVAPTTSTVLLLGETGSGKGVMAEAVHALSARASGPFVAVNCGAIAESLLESELFGAEKGAYTGASQLRLGYFEYAAGGTLFLDEIGELPLGAQAHLLHALEKRVIHRVGSPRPVPVDVRIVAATNRDLREMVRAGSFRQDLYYRLSIYPITVPPLRLRRGDILPLARHFLGVKSAEMGIHVPTNIPQEEVARLMAYDWPGNVRELGNVVERALINHERGKPLRFALEDEAGTPAPDPEGADWPTLRELEDRYLRRVLEKTGGNMAEAARIMGVHYTTLHAWAKRTGGASPEKDTGAGRKKGRRARGEA